MRNRLNGFLLSPMGHSLVTRLEKIVPPIRAWHRFAYEHHFSRLSREERLYRGVYGSFEEAARAVPATHRIGYNHPVAGRLHQHFIGQVWASDYPILFWLKPALRANPRLFDFGGNVGLHYYSFHKYLADLGELDWLICDLPEITKAGEAIAQERSSQVRFTNDFSAAEGIPTFLTSGALQYIEPPFAGSLARLTHKPEHLLINKLPLSNDKTYVTLQNMGPIICPYYIFNRNEFIESICAQGYECIDRWSTPEFDCYIPFYPEKSLHHFTGLYFRRK